MTRSDRTIATGPSPYANEAETLKACLARHGYEVAHDGVSVFGSPRVVIRRSGRTVLRPRNVWQTTAWLIRRNRKVAALGGAK